MPRFDPSHTASGRHPQKGGAEWAAVAILAHALDRRIGHGQLASHIVPALLVCLKVR